MSAQEGVPVIVRLCGNAAGAVEAVWEEGALRFLDLSDLNVFTSFAALHSNAVLLPAHGSGNKGWTLCVFWKLNKVPQYGALWVDNLWELQEHKMTYLGPDWGDVLPGWESIPVAKRVRAELVGLLPNDLKKRLAKLCREYDDAVERIDLLNEIFEEGPWVDSDCFVSVRTFSSHAPDSLVRKIKFWDQSELYITTRGFSLKPPKWLVSYQKAYMESPKETALRLGRMAFDEAEPPPRLC